MSESQQNEGYDQDQNQGYGGQGGQDQYGQGPAVEILGRLAEPATISSGWRPWRVLPVTAAFVKRTPAESDAVTP